MSLFVGALWQECELTNCARRDPCGCAFGQGFNSPRLHHWKKSRLQRSRDFFILISLLFFNIENFLYFQHLSAHKRIMCFKKRNPFYNPLCQACTKNKKSEPFGSDFFGADGGTWTHTPLRALAPEASASAIPPHLHILFVKKLGASDGTWTHTSWNTRPSNVPVYQFQHTRIDETLIV